MALNYSPEEWRDYLNDCVLIRQPDCDRYEDYYGGRHPMAFATAKFKEAFGDLFDAFADNFMELVVDVPVDKLHVSGFEFGDPEVNAEAMRQWRLNGLERHARIAHTEAVKCRASYVLVDPVLKRITVQHPRMAYVEVDPADPLKRLAGILRWVDVDGRTYVNVYLPDAVHKWATKEGESSKPVATLPGVERLAVDGGWEKIGEVRNDLGVVTLIPLENNPSLLRGGKSDLDVVIPLQDGTNKELMDMFIASEYQAFKQRVLTGVEVPKYPEGHALEGQPMPSAELMAAISRTWFIEDSEAKVTELGGSDLSNYVNVVEMLVQHIATKARIPPQHFLAGGATLANVNAESMVIIQDGFVSKVERKQTDFGPTWAEAVRLLLRSQGKTVPDDVVGSTKWAPVQKPSIVGLADALAKLAPLGVPFEWMWEQLGVSPEDAADWRVQLDKRTAKADAAAKAALEAQRSQPQLVDANGAPLPPSTPSGDLTPSQAPPSA